MAAVVNRQVYSGNNPVLSPFWGFFCFSAQGVDFCEICAYLSCFVTAKLSGNKQMGSGDRLKNL